MERHKVYTSYNPFFLVPFFLWLAGGAVFQLYLTKQELFLLVNSRHNDVLDTVMKWVTHMGEGGFIIPVALLLLLRKQFRNLVFLGAALFANIGAFLFSQGLKSYFNYPRPLLYFKEATLIHMLPEWDRYFHRSFPSGHSTGAFAIFCFLSLLLKPGHKGWGVVFFVLALSVAYSRIYLAAHFFADVYMGSIIGALFSILAVTVFYQKPYLYKT
ncbi:MAG TPA: phosphatase PAP2 family protein [Flavipsychrobacter sp.]|nr:phosphatase PAP2 family protein [Flavipsychrobacter sp.]